MEITGNFLNIMTSGSSVLLLKASRFLERSWEGKELKENPATLPKQTCSGQRPWCFEDLNPKPRLLSFVGFEWTCFTEALKESCILSSGLLLPQVIMGLGFRV